MIEKPKRPGCLLRGLIRRWVDYNSLYYKKKALYNCWNITFLLSFALVAKD